MLAKTSESRKEGDAMARDASSAAELTDEQIAQEQEFLRGLPRVNLGALLLPPVWGAGHGMMPTIQIGRAHV